MMRLIDAEVLAKFIDFGHLRNPNEKAYSENDIREMIDMCVTIDAPVRHGRWSLDTAHTEEIYAHPVKCSVCGRTEVLGYETLTPYCPNCGAKMDEEVD